MSGRTIVLVLLLFGCAALPRAAAAANVPRGFHRERVRLHPFVGFRRRFRPIRLRPLLIPTPGIEPPSPVEEVPAPSEEFGAPMQFPHGFSLTIPVGNSPRGASPNTLTRFVDVGRALTACWSPPAGAWSAITLRVSFKRDGSVNGEPRIPFVAAPSPSEKAELRTSLLQALQRCAPLPFSPSLGSAIAGEIFAIRFTHQDRP